MKVYGDRVCRYCKGICHEDSIRDRFGERRKYFCSLSCLLHFVEDGVERYIEDEECRRNYSLSSSDFKKYWESSYEEVDVISRGER